MIRGVRLSMNRRSALQALALAPLAALVKPAEAAPLPAPATDLSKYFFTPSHSKETLENLEMPVSRGKRPEPFVKCRPPSLYVEAHQNTPGPLRDLWKDGQHGWVVTNIGLNQGTRAQRLQKGIEFLESCGAKWDLTEQPYALLYRKEQRYGGGSFGDIMSWGRAGAMSLDANKLLVDRRMDLVDWAIRRKRMQSNRLGWGRSEYSFEGRPGWDALDTIRVLLFVTNLAELRENMKPAV